MARIVLIFLIIGLIHEPATAEPLQIEDLFGRASVLQPRPGNPGQFIIEDSNGNRILIIKPRPGNPGQFIIETPDGKRVGVIKK